MKVRGTWTERLSERTNARNDRSKQWNRSQTNSGCWGKDKTCTGMDRKTERVWQTVPWGCCCFRLLPAYCVVSSPPTPTHTSRGSSLAFISSPPSICFTTLHSPVWEHSCAAAAILNYIGQWEIVFMCLLLFYAWWTFTTLHSSSKRGSEQNVNISTRHIRYHKRTHINAMCPCATDEGKTKQNKKKKIVMMQTSRNTHANEPWSLKQQTKMWHMVLMEQKHTKARVTGQVSRTSCDKDTIESGERWEKEDLKI